MVGQPGADKADSSTVFLCHSSGDKDAVRKLYYDLRADGYIPWLDEQDLLPGQDWNLEITKSVRSSAIVLVCLSQGAVSKTGYVQKEIKYVLDVAAEQPEGSIFVIPVRLEPCDVPDRLGRWHWVDLFEKDGYARLRKALVTKGLVARPVPKINAIREPRTLEGGIRSELLDADDSDGDPNRRPGAIRAKPRRELRAKGSRQQVADASTDSSVLVIEVGRGDIGQTAIHYTLDTKRGGGPRAPRANGASTLARTGGRRVQRSDL